MSHDMTVLGLLRSTARAFLQRHRSTLQQVESVQLAEFPECLLREITDLGWCDALDDRDANAGTDANPATRDQRGAELLGVIVCELGRQSPTLATRLLSHHFCRFCCARSGQMQSRAAAPVDMEWYGVEGSVFDRRVSSTLTVAEGASGMRLEGTLRSVVGGGTAARVLGSAGLPNGEVALVLVSTPAARSRSPVATLGLRGLGVVDFEFIDVDASGFRVIARGIETETVLSEAFRWIGLGYVQLTLAMLDTLQSIVMEHTRTRRQDGRFLREIPAVRRQLECIEQALAFTRLMSQSYWESPGEVEPLMTRLNDATLQATDSGMQALGGMGYMSGSGTERLWRDIRQVGQIFVPKSW